MKKLCILGLLILAQLGSAAEPGGTSSVPPLANKRVLWLGASITQQGDYVTFVDYYLNRLYPSQTFDIISIGLASETVSGLTEKEHPFPRPNLFNRLTNALTLVKPQIVFSDYGVNDGIYHPQSVERTKTFQDGTRHLAEAVSAAQAHLILLTPLPFDPLPVKSVRPASAPDFAYFAPYVNYDDVISSYAEWELTASLPGVSVIDLHAPIAGYLKQRRETEPHFSFGTDGIHPNTVGHLLMARTILEALGVPMNTNSLEAELKRVQADPLFGLVAKQRQVRSEGWLPFVGYTREKTVKTDDIEPTEKAVAELQQQIDEMRHKTP